MNHRLAPIALLLLLANCTSLDRLAQAPPMESRTASILDIPDARFYLQDTQRIARIEANAERHRRQFKPSTEPTRILAISGGGDDGAFGAGLLVGWSAHGDRPDFDVVTGVSTGALTAPMAFLGAAYDPALRRLYTEIGPAQVYQPRPTLLAAVAADAVADSAPLRSMIDRQVDNAMMDEIAQNYRRGRLLLVLTTNLDQARPVIWNIGAIADSGKPQARELIVNILLASASIPGVFPPVMLDITVDGRHYQEMHVDGGAVAQSFAYPPLFHLKGRRVQARGEPISIRRKRAVYVIRNGRLPPDETVKPQTIAIVKRAVSTMIASNGANDIYRMYLFAKRDKADFNLAFIGDDFAVRYGRPFDPAYMSALFDYGYRQAAAGYKWQKLPPGYSE